MLMLMRIPWVVLVLGGLMRLGCPWIRLRGRFVLRLSPWVVGRLGRLGRPWVMGRLLGRPWAGCLRLRLLSPWVGYRLVLLGPWGGRLRLRLLSPRVVGRLGRLGRPWVVGRFVLVRRMLVCMGVRLLSPRVGLWLAAIWGLRLGVWDMRLLRDAVWGLWFAIWSRWLLAPWISLVGRLVLRLCPRVCLLLRLSPDAGLMLRLCIRVRLLLRLSPWVVLGLLLLMLPRVVSFDRGGGAGENCKGESLHNN